jgi:hypothetical protein
MAIDEGTKSAVWKKGKIAGSNDAGKWRKDECGAWIGFDAYGNRNSQYGWEIDHIVSQDHGGSDAISNLRPLQWQNNASKGSGRLVCAVTASGKDNRAV